MQSTQQETIATENRLGYLQFPGGGSRPPHAGPLREAGWVAEGARGKHGQELWLWFLQEEMGKAA